MPITLNKLPPIRLDQDQRIPQDPQHINNDVVQQNSDVNDIDSTIVLIDEEANFLNTVAIKVDENEQYVDLPTKVWVTEARI